eukprot:gene4716-6620_t
METFSNQPNKLNILICSDIDSSSASRLAEKFVPQAPIYDAVILIGPFTHKQIESKEENVIVEGEIASIVAQFENIVCRVIYLCTPDFDPVDSLTNQSHLTPNSVNIYARKMNLTQNLYITGFSESGYNLQSSKIPSHVDRSDESDDELENVELKSGVSLSIIQELLAHEEDSSAKLDSFKSTGILLMCYKYSHTLNQLLFHMSEQLDSAGVNLCVITSPNSEDATRLPKIFGKLAIAAPKSLRLGGFYTSVCLELNALDNMWKATSIDTESIYS